MRYLIVLLLLLAAAPVEVSAQEATSGSGGTRPYTELSQANAESLEKEIKELEETLEKKKAKLASLKTLDKSEEGDGVAKVGDSIDVDGLVITITEAYETDERNEFHDVKPDTVLVIHYTAENTTDEDAYLAPDSFSLYADNKLMGVYPNNNTYAELSSGRALEGIAHFEVFGGETLELEHKSFNYSSKEVGLWNIEL